MARLTTDSSDPDLGHGVDSTPVAQHDAYLVLSEDERAKGFVRPVRTRYKHVGLARPELRPLTAEEQARTEGLGYVAYEEYPSSAEPLVGRYWTQEDLDGFGCGTTTTMSLPLAETYAREPGFYGATYCCGCMTHSRVEEFVWAGTTLRVGS